MSIYELTFKIVLFLLFLILFLKINSLFLQFSAESYETDSSCRYYCKKDLPSVLRMLSSFHPSYCTIVGAISALSGASSELSHIDYVDHSTLNSSHKKRLSKFLDLEATSSENGTIANSEGDKIVVDPGWDSIESNL